MVKADKVQELVEQSDRDIADYVMAMDALMMDEPLCAEWKIRREFWMSQISDGRR
jgi:hypothetical protein